MFHDYDVVFKLVDNYRYTIKTTKTHKFVSFHVCVFFFYYTVEFNTLGSFFHSTIKQLKKSKLQFFSIAKTL